MHEVEKCGWNSHKTPTSGSPHPAQWYELGPIQDLVFHLFYMSNYSTTVVRSTTLPVRTVFKCFCGSGGGFVKFGKLLK